LFLSCIYGTNLRKIWKEIAANFIETSDSYDVTVDARNNIEMRETRSLPRP